MTEDRPTRSEIEMDVQAERDEREYLEWCQEHHLDPDDVLSAVAYEEARDEGYEF